MGQKNIKEKVYFKFSLNIYFKDLKTVHKEMPINEAVFEATLKNLNDSLEKFKVGPEIIDDVMSIMKSTKNDVVSVKVYPKLW